ncbi:MAG: DUF5681 domain-containing protein [Legionellaceae bacterium]|nr:DUF5681 domain-containing protein [Legionellaceae bacterium]
MQEKCRELGCDMAKFQKGISGNPLGKKLGTLNKKTQLAKHFEVHAEALIDKTIELGLSGDPVALRLCIERLVPKAKDNTATVVMPDSNSMETTKIIPMLLQSLAGQELSLTDFKNMMDIFIAHDNEVQKENKKHEVLKLDTKDPIEAAKAYARIMQRS